MADGDEVQMSIPAQLAYSRLARVAVAGLATRAGFSFDEVEDLKLAVGEVCSVVLDGSDQGGTLNVTFRPMPGHMEIEVGVAGPAGRSDGTGTLLSDQILKATVDSIDVSDEGRRIVIAKAAEDAD